MWYSRQDRRDDGELPGLFVQGARDLQSSVEGGRGHVLRKLQLMVAGKEEMAITEIWVTDGVDRCHVGFVPCHMVKHAARYDGALA
jgi:hypothetical protein